MNEVPDFLNHGVFKKVLEVATISNLTKDQRAEYEESLKQMENEYAMQRNAHKKGVKDTETRMKIEMIEKLSSIGTMPVSEIAEIVGVKEAYVKKIEKMANTEE